VDAELRAELAADIAFTVSTWGTLLDQRTSTFVRFDPNAIAPRLQNGILEFVAKTPRDSDGNKLWLDVVSSRQSGKSVTTALAMWARTAYNPGVYSATIADIKERAEDLFRAVTICQNNVDDAVRMPTIPNRESRQLTFEHEGKYRSLSVGGNMVGIGRSCDNLHISEAPFADGMGEAWNGILPAVINRAEACVIRESTPAPLTQPSAEWFRDECNSSRLGHGRSRFLFEAFYGSLLNQRTWNPAWKLEADEIKLLEKFGPKNGEPLSSPGEFRYLTLESLAFRRAMLNNDSELRRTPELFLVYFPTDPVSCWQHSGEGSIPAHALEKHTAATDLVVWTRGDTYKRYKDGVTPNAVYAIGVDPAGWTGGDQASFQALEVWADEWDHVSEFSSNTVDPPAFARLIIEEAERLNDANVIVENNGVGLATLTLLELATRPSGVLLNDAAGRERRYHLKNLYYHQLAGSADNKPGIAAGARTNAEGLVSLIDALMDRLKTRSAEFLAQAGSYKRDKEVEESDKWKIMNPGKSQERKRPKHHWDRVSAMIWACHLARTLPQRFKVKPPEEVEARRAGWEERARTQGWTQREMEAMEADQKKVERALRRQRKARQL
jgi:hypothetical protein